MKIVKNLERLGVVVVNEKELDKMENQMEIGAEDTYNLSFQLIYALNGFRWLRMECEELRYQIDELESEKQDLEERIIELENKYECG